MSLAARSTPPQGARISHERLCRPGVDGCRLCVDATHRAVADVANKCVVGLHGASTQRRNFALSSYTVPTWIYVGWELLSTFPAQFAGLRTFYGGSVVELCLVAAADAPSGMGGQLFVDKSATRCIYLVETTDPQASSVRIQTTAGIKSIRLKT